MDDMQSEMRDEVDNAETNSVDASFYHVDERVNGIPIMFIDEMNDGDDEGGEIADTSELYAMIEDTGHENEQTLRDDEQFLDEEMNMDNDVDVVDDGTFHLNVPCCRLYVYLIRSYLVKL